jgi:hypothetical protein
VVGSDKGTVHVYALYDAVRPDQSADGGSVAVSGAANTEANGAPNNRCISSSNQLLCVMMLKQSQRWGRWGDHAR